MGEVSQQNGTSTIGYSICNNYCSYIAIIIPPQLVEKGLTAKQGEQAMHLANMEDHVMGEWYNLTAVQRAFTVSRFQSLGCSVREGQTRSPWLCLDGTEPGSPGNIYFARFSWDEYDLPIINILQQNIAHQSTCMKMLSVKIGCSSNIIRGTDDMKMMMKMMI